MNEARNLPTLVERLSALKCLDWVLFVVDDSTDGTEEVLERLSKLHPRIHIYRREGKKGLGTAIQEGLLYATENFRSDRIVTLDGDMSHDPEAIPSLLEVRAELVLGSRYVAGGQIPDWSLRRQVISRTANAVARRLLGLPPKDLTTGFRVYSSELAREVALRARCGGYELEIEGVEIAHHSGCRIAEVPIIFRERANGTSKMRTPDEFLRFLLFLARGFGRRVRGQSL